MVHRYSKAQTAIKVVHLLPNLDTGGMERLVVEMMRHADRGLIEPRIVCIGEAGALGAEAAALGIPIEALGQAPGRNLRLPRILARRFESLGVDVVHTHGPYAHFYGALARGIGARWKLVHTIHGQLWPWRRRNRWRNCLATALSDAVVAVCDDLRENWIRRDGCRTRKLRVIHNGVDTERFHVGREAIRRERPAAGMVARLAGVKDFETLLQATALITRRHARFELQLIGDGPLRHVLETRACELGIDGSVVFLGNQADVPRRLSELDMFILSSHSEGLSISLLEAMACGLPAIATDVGGNREVVRHGETGFLVPPGSAEALAARIAWLVEHPDEAAAMGVAGRRRVEDEFHVRQTARSYGDLYLELTGTAGRRPPVPEAVGG